ncbi:MAG: nitroreductase family protein [bacterium]|nr:nitroreductase family protein [bacterium]
MSADAKILSSSTGTDYVEEAPGINADEFQKVIDSRRSVRVYEKTPIPEDIVKKCLHNAVMAPNSSNLQQWEFYRVKTPDIKADLVKACLDQVAAKTAAELFVVVARTKTWKDNAAEMLELFEKGGDKTPAMAIKYYKKLVPFVYSMGVFGLLGMVKRLIYFFKGISTPIIREPVTRNHIKLWAVKSTALGAENLMLSLRAYGYDSCPMEGYDSKRIKKLLGLSRDSVVVMVISAGKRAAGGIYGPRIRFDSSRFIKHV